jgi:UDP-galactopyranose mutase
VRDGLSEIGNLFVAGRSGCFAYQNMDHAVRSGIDTARQLLAAGSTR